MKKLIIILLVTGLILSGHAAILFGVIFGIGLPMLLLMGIADIFFAVIGKHHIFYNFSQKLKKYGIEYGVDRHKPMFDGASSSGSSFDNPFHHGSSSSWSYDTTYREFH